MGDKNKNILVRDSRDSRDFGYSKGGVRLNFTLRIDIKQELKIFAELLEVALKDVKEELNKK